MTLLTTEETAQRLGVHPSRVRVLAREGRLPAQQVGRAWVFRPADVERFAAQERRPGRPKETAR